MIAIGNLYSPGLSALKKSFDFASASLNVLSKVAVPVLAVAGYAYARNTLLRPGVVMTPVYEHGSLTQPNPEIFFSEWRYNELTKNLGGGALGKGLKKVYEKIGWPNDFFLNTCPADSRMRPILLSGATPISRPTRKGGPLFIEEHINPLFWGTAGVMGSILFSLYSSAGRKALSFIQDKFSLPGQKESENMSTLKQALYGVPLVGLAKLASLGTLIAGTKLAGIDLKPFAQGMKEALSPPHLGVIGALGMLSLNIIHAEEFLCRYLIQDVLCTKIPEAVVPKISNITKEQLQNSTTLKILKVALSSAAFGAIHLANIPLIGAGAYAQIAAACGFGIVAGAAREITGRSWAPYGLHWAANLIDPVTALVKTVLSPSK